MKLRQLLIVFSANSVVRFIVIHESMPGREMNPACSARIGSMDVVVLHMLEEECFIVATEWALKAPPHPPREHVNGHKHWVFGNGNV